MDYLYGQGYLDSGVIQADGRRDIRSYIRSPFGLGEEGIRRETETDALLSYVDAGDRAKAVSSENFWKFL